MFNWIDDCGVASDYMYGVIVDDADVHGVRAVTFPVPGVLNITAVQATRKNVLQMSLSQADV